MPKIFRGRIGGTFSTNRRKHDYSGYDNHRSVYHGLYWRRDSWEGEQVNECCGTCKWHRHKDMDDGWVCVNPDSEYFTDWTEYHDSCSDFEERD